MELDFNKKIETLEKDKQKKIEKNNRLKNQLSALEQKNLMVEQEKEFAQKQFQDLEKKRAAENEQFQEEINNLKEKLSKNSRMLTK